MNDHQLYRMLTGEYDISFYFAFEWVRPPSWNFTEYRIPALTFWYIMEGDRRLQIGGTEYAIEPGDILTLPADAIVTTTHTEENELPIHYFSMGVQAIAGGMSWSELFGIPVRITPAPCGELTELASLWRRLIADAASLRQLAEGSEEALFSAYASMRSLAWEARLKLWLSLLTQLALPYMTAAEPASDQRVRAICAYIRAHCARPLSAREIAREVCMSEGHMRATFRQVMGLTPHQYAIQVRLEKAKELLAMTELTLSEVAERTGFDDVSYFINSFRKREGTTPAVYRKRMYPWSGN